jgi:hypothetical protein
VFLVAGGAEAEGDVVSEEGVALGTEGVHADCYTIIVQ